MRRADIKHLFPEASGEQIDALMKMSGAENERHKAEVSELQRQIEEAAGRISELEAAGADLPRLHEVEAAYNDMRRAADLREMRERIAKEAGVPADLLIHQDTEESCYQYAIALRDYYDEINPPYPHLHNPGEGGNSFYYEDRPTLEKSFARMLEKAEQRSQQQSQQSGGNMWTPFYVGSSTSCPG